MVALRIMFEGFPTLRSVKSSRSCSQHLSYVKIGWRLLPRKLTLVRLSVRFRCKDITYFLYCHKFRLIFIII